jgi:phytoene dehydrogenase-like protein
MSDPAFDYDLAIIGSGGGAFAAAIRPTNRGKGVLMVERSTVVRRATVSSVNTDPDTGDVVVNASVSGGQEESRAARLLVATGRRPVFYAYTYPEPAGYAEYAGQADGAVYNQGHRLYLLPYENVRTAPDPDRRLLRFLHSTYEAAAETGHWDRAGLEVDPGHWRR